MRPTPGGGPPSVPGGGGRDGDGGLFLPERPDGRRTAEQIEDAQSRVNRLFGEGAEDLGFKPIAGDGAIELLERVVELIARGPISSASLNIRGQCKAKFSITSKGKIKVSRSETRSCDLEAGE